MQKFEGIHASDGVAIGPAIVHRPPSVSTERHTVADTNAEMARFHHALACAREQLSEIQQQSTATLGAQTAAIFEAQKMFLEDPALLDAVESRIQAGVNAEAALAEEIEKFALMLANLDDAYMRERAADVRDVGQSVLRILAGVNENELAELDSPAIVIAADLSPSDTARMNRAMTLGFATARGGPTAHTAILARTLGLPAVVGLGDSVLQVQDGSDPIILDGQAGTLIVEPNAATLAEYRAKRARWRTARAESRASALEAAVTRDGHRVEVVANIGNAESAQTALAYGAEGVGLLRTEFLFLERASMPDEEEQYTTYRSIAELMESRPLIIRTLDVGGDKPPPYLDLGKELNPFLGWRAIRISLTHAEMFKTQLRAILRAGAGCNVKIMFPMITTLEEVRQARQLLDEARAELETRSVAFAQQVEVGIMVEVPAAAVSAHILARDVDFFSLGTNDLIQYTLAIDRTNERVGYLYDPLHPAILRLVKHVIDSAHAVSKWAGMCGEMAGEPDAIPLLLGLGLDEFSVNGAAVPQVKTLIRMLDFHAMQELAARALELATGAEIRALVREHVAS
jgi:phosphotransferase system enzyme I (PtsI)